MRIKNYKVRITFCLSCILYMMSNQLYALSMLKYSTDVLCQTSQWIVHAKVGEAQSRWEKKRIVTTFELEVIHSFKDLRTVQNSYESTVKDHIDVLGGTIDGITQMIPGNSTFKQGDEVLLFLKCLPKHTCMPVGFSQGVWRITQNPNTSHDIMWVSDFEKDSHSSTMITLKALQQKLRRFADHQKDSNIEEDQVSPTPTLAPTSINQP